MSDKYKYMSDEAMRRELASRDASIAELQAQLKIAQSQAIQARAQAVTVAAEREQAQADARELAQVKHVFCDLDIEGWIKPEAKYLCRSHNVRFVHAYGITSCPHIETIRAQYLVTEPHGAGEVSDGL